MTYEEYKQNVYEECLKDAVAQTYREDFEKVFKEMADRTNRDFEAGHSVADAAWGICLLI